MKKYKEQSLQEGVRDSDNELADLFLSILKDKNRGVNDAGLEMLAHDIQGGLHALGYKLKKEHYTDDVYYPMKKIEIKFKR